ncbi:hypothetical protein ILYODFUR_017924 [Ilyodon furcidens]|uniref:Uncharacterized protein n=1 Tax=Ilyodon furcidens TaxID=33524 RepID=A0ABV0TBX0_9TELE
MISPQPLSCSLAPHTLTCFNAKAGKTESDVGAPCHCKNINHTTKAWESGWFQEKMPFLFSKNLSGSFFVHGWISVSLPLPLCWRKNKISMGEILNKRVNNMKCHRITFYSAL